MNRDTRPIDVAEVIDRQPMSRFQILTVSLCGAVAVLDGFDTQCIGFLAPAMAESMGLPMSSFAPVFAAGLLGLMVGALILGPIADRYGRKWPAVIATLVFGCFAFLTAHVTTFNELVAFRFLTGLGLGGAMPNVVALTSEYAPKRLRTTLVATLFTGMPLGALIGGLVSSVMLPVWGWQSVFYLGGLLPLAVALLLIKALPESVRFLIARGADPRKVAGIMARVSPELAKQSALRFVSQEAKPQGLPVKHLFTEGRAIGTVLLWIPYFMNLLVLYFIVSWMPAVLREAGMPLSAGVMAITLFSLGGVVGSLIQGRLMTRLGNHIVLLGEFGLAALLIGSLAVLPTSLTLILALTFILGVSVQGAQAGINAVVAEFYPTAIRSTGVGWALGVGRVGSIIGPVLGGLMLSWHWTLQEIFLAGAVPALFAATAMGVLTVLRSRAAEHQLEPKPELYHA